MKYYLDHNATTPVCQEARAAMEIALGNEYGNPSSLHAQGRSARHIVELARATIADLIGAKTTEIMFTSGGTEANNTALYGARYAKPGSMRVLRYSAVEHKSILRVAERMRDPTVRKVSVVPVDADGSVCMADLEHSIDLVGSSCLVSIMHANNETGVIQPIEEIADLTRTRDRTNAGYLLHVDACQSFGKIPVDVDALGVDMMTLSAHKIRGPKGIGALYVRSGVKLDPFIVGGHQERDRRGGTENVAGIAGFAAAADVRCRRLADYALTTKAHRDNLSCLLRDGLEDIHVNGGAVERVPNTLNVRFDRVQSEALILMLSERDIYVSNGSACESGSVAGSHVLLAMGQTDEQSQSAIRFSFGTELAEGAVKYVAENVIECVELLRSMG